MTWNDLAKSRMKAVGVTQERLAEHLGKTQGAIGHWLNGRREPSLSEIASLLKYLSVDGIFLNSDGTIAVDESDLSKPLPPPQLTEQQKEYLDLLDSIPSEDAERFIDEMRKVKAHYDAIFEEMLKKRSIK